MFALLLLLCALPQDSVVSHYACFDKYEASSADSTFILNPGDQYFAPAFEWQRHFRAERVRAFSWSGDTLRFRFRPSKRIFGDFVGAYSGPDTVVAQIEWSDGRKQPLIFFRDTTTIEAKLAHFEGKLKRAILAHDYEGLSNMMSYPISVWIAGHKPGSRHRVRTRKGFLRLAPKIFSSCFVNSLRVADTTNTSSSKGLYEFGDRGDLWIGQFDPPDWQIKVSVINNAYGKEPCGNE